MIPWTTPTHELTVRGVDLTGYDVYVDYKQGSKSIHIEAADVQAVTTETTTDTTVTVELTQEQTGAFSPERAVDVQVNWVTPDGKRDATTVKQIQNGRQLYEKELAYGDTA